MPFSQLGLHPDLDRAVKALGWETPTPIQREAIPLALSGRDILGAAQTGSGKTAAFMLPILDRFLRQPQPGLRGLVLVPTRELASQVSRTVHELSRSTRTAVIIGGESFGNQTRALRDAMIVVATPGRLLDHLDQKTVQLSRVEMLVLDEADRMLDMGFLPDIKTILSYLPRQRQSQLFSATLLPAVEKIASFALNNPQRVEISPPATVAEGISQMLYPVLHRQKVALLVALLKDLEMRSVLVFTRTKFGADRLANKLNQSGFSVDVLHSNRTQSQRTAAMEGFRQGRRQILVATDIAARGIDVKDISHVINFDVPQHPEDYVHRVGRTARAYGVGDAITLMDPMEQSDVTAIEKFTNVVFPRALLPNFPYEIPPKLTPPVQASSPWDHRGKSRRRGPVRRGGWR